MVSRAGFEPATLALKGRYSTTELPAHTFVHCKIIPSTQPHGQSSLRPKESLPPCVKEHNETIPSEEVLKSCERIQAVLNFEKPDRLPVIEWAPYWDMTIRRWKSEGLPAELETDHEIRDYFGLDKMLDMWVIARKPDCPCPAGHGQPIITNEREYNEILPFLYPDPPVDPRELERFANAQQQEGAAVWCWIEGFFWHPRTLLGIEEHLYAFFDQPGLMKRMNENQLDFIKRAVDQITSCLKPAFLALGEDMSYNHGPMISKVLFDEHLAPFYLDATDHIKSKGLKILVDSDGLVDEPVDWYAEVGCDGFFPLEKQAGVDIAGYRVKHPRFLFMGGFDKTCMHRGEVPCVKSSSVSCR